MRLMKEAGFTIIEIVTGVVVVIIIAGVAIFIYTAAQDAARADAELVEITSVPTQIVYGGQGQLQLKVDFDRKAPRRQSVTIEIWEGDGAGDDRLGRKVVTLAKGKTSITTTFTLRCSPEGYLNGDDDDGDRKYDVYGYVVNDGNGNTLTEEDNNDVQCIEG